MKKTLLLILSFIALNSLLAQTNIYNLEKCDISYNFGTFFGDYINGVGIGVFGSDGNYNSGPTADTSGYEFITSSPFRIYRDLENLISVQNGTEQFDYVKAWIDYNNNGEFTESEALGNAQLFTGGAGSWMPIQFTVPEDVSAKTATLRVSLFFNQFDSLPCGTKNWGETEDYIIIINDDPAPYCSPIPETLYGSGHAIASDGDFLADINNNYIYSGFDRFAPEYSNYFDETFYGRQNDSTSLFFTYGEYFSDRIRVYIDFDQNEIFEEDEMVLYHQSSSSDEEWDPSFLVPADAPIGLTRMRVVFTFSSTDFACDEITYGHSSDYNFLVQPENGAYNSCYGNSTAGPQDGDYLQSYELGNIYYSTSQYKNKPYYQDRTSYNSYTYLVKGQSYDLALQGGSWDGDYYSVWIDYNNNNALESSERVFQEATSGADEIFNSTITIPDDAEEGATLLRFQCIYSELDANPCGDNYFSETHDHSAIITGSSATYCAASFDYGNTDDDYINGVSLGDINLANIGETFQPYYHDYTNLSTSLTTGSDYTLTVQSGNYYNDTFFAWIDYNQNGTFEGSESIGEIEGSTTFEDMDFSFSVPNNAAIGTTQMRIICADDWTDNTPCMTADYGEYMDFSINITAPELVDQTINFPIINDVLENIGSFSLNATATSGLPITYTVVSGPATIAGNTVSITGAGPVEIQASQGGNDEYNAAASVTQGFCSNPLQPTITDADMGDYTLLTSSATSGNQWLLNGADIAGATNQTYQASEVGLYTVFVNADGCLSQESDAFNLEDQTLSSQSITFDPIDDVLENVGSFSLNATASSGLDVSYSVVSGPATIAGNTVSITGAGPVEIQASQGGNDEYNAAASVTQSFCSNPLQPTITDADMGDYTLLTSSATSGNQWLLNGANISGATNQTYQASEVGIYTVFVNAGGCLSQESDAFNLEDQTLSSQSITFYPIDDVLENVGSFDLSATASSGLDVSYSVVSGPATIAGNTVTITGAGPVEIQASQGGNDEYNAAASVTQSFCSNPLQPTITDADMGDYTLLTSSATSGNQWLLNGANISGATNQTYQASEVGIYTVFVNAGGCLSAEADPFNLEDQSLLSQDITFDPLADVLENIGSFELSATASSGLDVSYSVVSGPATIAGNTVTITGAGPVEIQASQGGNTEYNPATPVSQNFCSNPLQPSITANILSNSVELTSSSPINNQWLLNTTEIPGANGQTYVATSNGMYAVFVDANGCTSETSDAYEVIAISVNELTNSSLECFPNPVTDALTIVMPSNEKYQYTITDMTGKIVQKGTFDGQEQRVTLPVINLQAGVYSLTLHAEGKIFTASIIKMD